MSIRRLRVGAPALALCLTLASGCSTVMQMDRAGDFDEAQLHFTQYLRYGRIAHASRFVVEEQREEFLALEPDLAHIHFTDYDVLEVDLDDEAKTAEVAVRYTGYRSPEMVERTVDFTQSWIHDEEKGKWMVSLEIDRIHQVLSGRAD